MRPNASGLHLCKNVDLVNVRIRFGLKWNYYYFDEQENIRNTISTWNWTKIDQNAGEYDT